MLMTHWNAGSKKENITNSFPFLQSRYIFPRTVRNSDISRRMGSSKLNHRVVTFFSNFSPFVFILLAKALYSLYFFGE
jgi:hypothetical protein